MGVEEEGKLWRQNVDVDPPLLAELDVRETVGKRERQLLRRGRAGFADVVTRHRDRVVLRRFARAELEQVADQAEVRLGREHPLLLRDVLLEDVGLQRSVELLPVDPLALGSNEVHREQDDGGPADRHRGGDIPEWDAVEELLHVGDRIDRHAAVADLPFRARVVGVAPHKRGHVERDRQPGPAAAEQHPVALVRRAHVAEPRELPDRPQAAAVSGGVDAARVREMTRRTDVLLEVDVLGVARVVERLQGLSGKRFEVGVTLVRALVLLFPVLLLIAHRFSSLAAAS